MIAKALDVLNHSAHGQQLVDMVRVNQIQIQIMATPQPVTYLPDTRKPYIGFSRLHPVTPVRFIMMLAGVLREVQQELAGVVHPPLTAQLDEHLRVSMAKHEDKLWYMCTIAWELDQQKTFSGFNFIETLRKMGHNEAVGLFLKQEQKI
jgi:hypothetical protein